MEPEVLRIAKESARTSGRIMHGPHKGSTVINLVGRKPDMRRGRARKPAIYLRSSCRDRLTHLASIMSVSVAEAIERIALLDYEPVPDGRLMTIGKPVEEMREPRDVRLVAEYSDETKQSLERLFASLKPDSGVVKSAASGMLDLILSEGWVRPIGFDSVETAAESMRRDPLTVIENQESEFAKISVRLSRMAVEGIHDIVSDFDHRRHSSRLSYTVEILSQLPVTAELTGEILAIRRTQRTLIISLSAVRYFTEMGYRMMLIDRPGMRRPSTLVSAVLEHIGQGAIQLIHKQRRLTSIGVLTRARNKRR